MYKINHKAVMFVFLLQLLLGGGWYYWAPATLVGSEPVVFYELPFETLFVFVFSLLVYLYFTAWLLIRIKWISSAGMMMLVISIWLFVVLPNYALVNFHLKLNHFDAFYLLSYSATNCAISALILPLWRSSKSIFSN